MTKLDSEILTRIGDCAARAMPDMHGCRSVDFDITKLQYSMKVCRVALMYFEGQLAIVESLNLDIAQFKGRL